MEIKGVAQGNVGNFENTSRNTQGSSGAQQSCGEGVKNLENIKIDKKAEGSSNEKEVKKAVDKLNKFLEDEDTHAEYAIHDKLGDLMIKIVNNKTGDVLLEIPPKKILDMVAKMCEMVGIIVDKKA